MNTVAADIQTRRLRDIRPFYSTNGDCEIIYDLERTFIIKVPNDIRFPLVASLESKCFDGMVSAWLMEQDLLTRKDRPNWKDPMPAQLPPVTDMSLDLSGACNMGCKYCFENEIASRIGAMSSDTIDASLDFAFSNLGNAHQLSLHFGSGETLLRFNQLQYLVEEAERRAAQRGVSVHFDLTTNATLVSDEIACFLAAHPFSVRVSCDGPAELHDHFRPMINGRPSYTQVELGLRRLLTHMPDQVTVNTVICGKTRLSEVWSWAKQLGIRHYHVIKVGTVQMSPMQLDQTELTTYQNDLSAICDDLWTDLESGLVPIDYQPITKIIRRLMLPQPITRFCGVASTYLGIASDGKIYPCFRHLGLQQYEFGNLHSGVNDDMRRQYLKTEACDVETREFCRDCWARFLCGGGCYADSVVYGPSKTAPQLQHCPYWQAEIDSAIRFYNRMREADPIYCLTLFADSLDRILGTDAVDAPGFKTRMNCS